MQGQINNEEKNVALRGLSTSCNKLLLLQPTESHPQKGTADDQRVSAPRGGKATSRVAPPEANIADMLRKRRRVRRRARRKETVTLLRLQNKTGEISSTHVCF